MSLFKIENVNFLNILFYKDIEIKDDITFLVGESGAGKTTLLKLLNGSLSPVSGNVYYKNQNIKDMDKLMLRKEVVLVSQRIFLFHASVKENFQIYYDYIKRKAPSDDEIVEFLKICEIDIDIKRDVSNLSGGEKQRVYNAIALSFKPKVLLMDEPTSSLDFETGKNFLENIFSYSRKNNIKLVIISHDRNLVDELHENIIYIEKSVKNE